MTRSQLQFAVAQYTVLVSINLILVHEIGRDAYTSVWEDPVFKNLIANFNTAPNTTVATNTTSINITSINSTSAVGSANPSSQDSVPESFYLKSLPRGVFIQALLFPLLYYWQIFLERFFPTRPRGVEIRNQKQEKVDVDGNEDREEEVVKRWIAQGKVTRSTVSWWNTFVKWVLDLSVGRLWFCALWNLVDGFVRWRSFSKIMGGLMQVRRHRFHITPKSLPLGHPFPVLGSFVGISPLTSLMGFLVVPAAKRVVFEAGVDLVWSVFISAFFRLAIPWVISTEFVQIVLANVTEQMKVEEARQGAGGMNGRLIGEL